MFENFDTDSLKAWFYRHVYRTEGDLYRRLFDKMYRWPVFNAKMSGEEHPDVENFKVGEIDFGLVRETDNIDLAIEEKKLQFEELSYIEGVQTSRQ